MSLRNKVLFVLLGFEAGSLIISISLMGWLVNPEFNQLETNSARSGILRCADVLSLDVRDLGQRAASLSNTARLVNIRGDAERIPNINAYFIASMGQHRLDVAALYTREGDLRAWRGANPESAVGESTAWPETIKRGMQTLIDAAATNKPAQGLAMSEAGPLLLAAHRCRPVNAAEAGKEDVLVIGRYLTTAALADMRQRSGVALQILPVGEADDLSVFGSEGIGMPVHVATLDDRTMRARGLLKDIAGEPALILQADFEQTIAWSGQRTVWIAMMLRLIAGVVVFVAMLLTMQWLVIRPLNKVTEHVAEVEHSQDFSAMLEMKGQDEFGRLAEAINNMSQQTLQTRQALLETSYRTGRAEVAANVLHNLGNTLNSLNVALESLATEIRNSHAEGIGRAVDLIRGHEGDTAAFFADPVRTAQLVSYLEELGVRLLAEQGVLRSEVDQAQGHVNQLKRTIQLQQNYLLDSIAPEPTRMEDVADDAIKLVEGALRHDSVTVTRSYDPVPLVVTERHKILQILINLIDNGRRALQGAATVAKEVRIAIGADGDDAVIVTVKDNGCGMDPRTQAHLFEYGFSTREQGHGHGLFLAAQLARQIGAEIVGASGGPGQGSAFTLRVPLTPEGHSYGA